MRVGVVEQARASFAQRSWGDAYAQFATADATTPLGLNDLEKLALAAYLTGHDEESTLAWTRAHHEAIRHGDPQRAARNAFLIGSGLMFRGERHQGWDGSRAVDAYLKASASVQNRRGHPPGTPMRRCGAETRRERSPFSRRAR